MAACVAEANALESFLYTIQVLVLHHRAETRPQRTAGAAFDYLVHTKRLEGDGREPLVVDLAQDITDGLRSVGPLRPLKLHAHWNEV